MSLCVYWQVLALLSLALYANAIGQSTCASFNPSSSSFPIVSRGAATPILLSSDDWPGVQLAANIFSQDIKRVTGVTPVSSNVTASNPGRHSSAIIVGTLGRSSLIEAIVNNTKLDVSSVDGHWEAFMTRVVKNPLPGIDEAYVMIGADKRGTIFALYDHSEQFGGSPQRVNVCTFADEFCNL